jgi:hypothetical protein
MTFDNNIPQEEGDTTQEYYLERNELVIRMIARYRSKIQAQIMCDYAVQLLSQDDLATLNDMLFVYEGEWTTTPDGVIQYSRAITKAQLLENHEYYRVLSSLYRSCHTNPEAKNTMVTQLIATQEKVQLLDGYRIEKDLITEFDELEFTTRIHLLENILSIMDVTAPTPAHGAAKARYHLRQRHAFDQAIVFSTIPMTIAVNIATKLRENLVINNGLFIHFESIDWSETGVDEYFDTHHLYLHLLRNYDAYKEYLSRSFDIEIPSPAKTFDYTYQPFIDAITADENVGQTYKAIKAKYGLPSNISVKALRNRMVQLANEGNEQVAKWLQKKNAHTKYSGLIEDPDRVQRVIDTYKKRRTTGDLFSVDDAMAILTEGDDELEIPRQLVIDYFQFYQNELGVRVTFHKEDQYPPKTWWVIDRVFYSRYATGNISAAELRLIVKDVTGIDMDEQSIHKYLQAKVDRLINDPEFIEENYRPLYGQKLTDYQIDIIEQIANRFSNLRHQDFNTAVTNIISKYESAELTDIQENALFEIDQAITQKRGWSQRLLTNLVRLITGVKITPTTMSRYLNARR